VEARLDCEDERTNHYLSSQTTIPLRRILENNLLTPHLWTVITMPDSGLDYMIDLDKASDVARLYRLALLVPSGLPCIRKALKQSIERRGKDINQASLEMGDGDVNVDSEVIEDNKAKGKAKARLSNFGSQTLSFALKWVQDVLDLRDKFDRVWRQSFQCDRELESGLNEVHCVLAFWYMTNILHRPLNHS